MHWLRGCVRCAQNICYRKDTSNQKRDTRCVTYLGSLELDGESLSVGIPDGSKDWEGTLERDGSNEGFKLGNSLGRLLGDCDG